MCVYTVACRKDQPVKWSAVAKSGDADITITQCEAYGLAEFGHEYEELPTSEMTSQPPNPEYEIPTAQCPAYTSYLWDYNDDIIPQTSFHHRPPDPITWNTS